MKLFFDHFNHKKNFPFPNLWHEKIREFYLDNGEEYNFNTDNWKFILRTCHSELTNNLINVLGYKLASSELNDELYIYPIEFYGGYAEILGDEILTMDGISYNFGLDNISEIAINLAKEKKLYFVINYSHETFSDEPFMNKFEEKINEKGLFINNFLFFVGTSNLFELKPNLKKFHFYFEDNLLQSSAKKIIELKSNPNHALNYKTDWIDVNEVDVKRKKHFVCPNRHSNKSHRFNLGLFFESKNLWDKLYCSFLEKYNKNVRIYNNNLEKYLDTFTAKLPIEMDTESIDYKLSFEVMRAFKKEIYLDSYINIVTESSFFNDIFVTEKILNPITVLQPFIVFSSSGYLKYIKKLGFKTFSPFIDESYDDEMDNIIRFNKLCNEIERLSKKSIDELHSWYIEIIPILEYNRNHAITFSNKKMFIESIKSYINYEK